MLLPTFRPCSGNNMRLDKFLAHASGESRKTVKLWIRQRRVRVDAQRVTDAGIAVAKGASVSLDGKPLALAGESYIMLNKPAGTVSTAEHADARSVMTLLPAALRSRLHIVGRLDVDTTGLMLLSSDGDWSHRITAPAQHCLKVYRVQLSDPLGDAAATALLDGVMLGGEKSPLRARALHRHDELNVDITLGEGRYHQVKRMFAAVQNHVETLQRVQMGGLILDASLPPGQWRELSLQERASVFETGT